jgi:hypothetical protein
VGTQIKNNLVMLEHRSKDVRSHNIGHVRWFLGRCLRLRRLTGGDTAMPAFFDVLSLVHVVQPTQGLHEKYSRII